MESLSYFRPDEIPSVSSNQQIPAAAVLGPTPEATQPQLATLAFVDLETSGIPEFQFFKTKITEISIIACSKKHFLESSAGEIPRVLHKLTLCVNPYHMINPKASEVSGLYNDLLEQDNKFDKNTTELLQNFLNHLQKPVCLVAHNGLRFDFPILHKEILKTSKLLSEDIYCTDSLNAFRLIDAMGDEPQPLNTLPTTVDDATLSSFIASELELLTQDSTHDIPLPSSQNAATSEPLNCSQLLMEQNNMGRQILNETTPKRQKIMSTHERSHNVRRGLYGGVRKSYKLPDIYKRFFGKLPDVSHQAEADVVTLLKCAIAVKSKFAQYADNNCIPFKDVKPLGFSNNSINILN